MNRLLVQTSMPATLKLLLALGLLVWLTRTVDGMQVGFATPVLTGDLDRSGFAEYVDGHETWIGGADSARQPSWVIWTQSTAPGWAGFSFGNTATSGKRHLRIGFTNPVPVGSILVLGDVCVSLLKASSPYPGNVADESQWVPAQRLKMGQLTPEQPGRNDYSIWIWQSQIMTRALRFTHEAAVNDSVYAGWLGGAYVLAERFTNIATQGKMSASANNQLAGQMNREGGGGIWEAWANISSRDGFRQESIAQKPEWVVLEWRHPRALAGLGLLAAGFGAAEIQVYAGPADRIPREAKDSDWKMLKELHGLKNQYPRPLAIDWVDFGETVTTRAVRLRLTATTDEGHSHMQGLTMQGERVWLGGLMAMQSLGSEPTERAPTDGEEAHQNAPIGVTFALPSDGDVTLVIEDDAGNRVRNLLSAVPFGKGSKTVYWDGSSDTERDLDAAAHGSYHVPGQLVPPGNYRVRGLWHKPLKLAYEFAVNSDGSPPWPTSDTSGGWTTNHTPPSSVLSVPATETPGSKPRIYIGSYVSEGGAALAWVDLGGRKIGGRGWIGGNWTGAQYLARDAGLEADPEIYAFVGTAWRADPAKNENEIRLTGLRQTKGDEVVLNYGFAGKGKSEEVDLALGGIAAYNGVLVLSQTSYDQLIAVRVETGAVIGKQSLPSPRGVAFDSEGRLLILTADRLLRYRVRTDRAFVLDSAETLAVNLDQPCGITISGTGDIYVSERGNHHQVQQFDAKGRFLRSFGVPGIPQVGPYQPEHMNNPKGLAVDANGRLWVAEEDFQPKRVSVWNPDGTLWRAFYGPPRYGGGGSIDPQDKTRFDYDGMEFRVDWATGRSRLDRVLYRQSATDQILPNVAWTSPPQVPIYFHGRRYLTNAFTDYPTNGSTTAFLFEDKGGSEAPVAAMGRASDWGLLLQPNFASRWRGRGGGQASKQSATTFFIWSDLNEDGQVEPNEVSLYDSAEIGGVTIQRDGSFVIARLGFPGRRINAVSFTPVRITGEGVPIYDFNGGKVVAHDVNNSLSDGGDQVLTGTDGWTVLMTAPHPFSPAGIGGIKDGVGRWSYPSLWPGLHASHSAPVPESSGELIGTTRLLGDLVAPRHSEAGPMFFLNGNLGNIYAFTSDGMFVAALFQDERLGKRWSMPIAKRGMLLDDVSPGGEHFYPTVSQTNDGNIYLVAGNIFSAIVRVDGLDTVRRLGPWPLHVSTQDLANAEDFVSQQEAARQAAQGTDLLTVPLLSAEPVFDQSSKDWPEWNWVDIDQRGVAAFFDSNSRPYSVKGSIVVADQRLFATWATGDPKLLENSGDPENALFKSGGALDLMLGPNPLADPKRTRPVAGDERLLVTRVKGQTKAWLYRAVVPGSNKAMKVAFSSPWRTITFDRVDDISNQVKLAADGKGNYQISIPLEIVGLAPEPGMHIKADIGILRGEAGKTLQRVYWNNKATAIVEDVPSEAMLTPQLWGTLVFQASVVVAGPKVEIAP